ncbi:MAG: helix-turn-helix domain-containing protein [Streptococcaceae bacterium]|jgi:transcriptional regulator with XRE-family HTH domain|nr:helix-turn-helix domain-containing protein [Streptococcaceae bacterium]MCH4177269.1 helix-turn-helix domain-containing protein [Streptococcaceae bacterium]
MSLFDNVSKLAKQRNINLTDLAEELGLSRHAFYKWKTSSPKAETLEKVADYFGVSIDYLLDRDSVSLNEDLEDSIDVAMLYSGKKLNDVDRATIKALLKGYFDNKKD